MRDKGRAAIYTLAAVYLIYLAYEVFRARMANGGEDYIWMIVFSIFFAAIGIALLVFSIILIKQQSERNPRADKEMDEL